MPSEISPDNINCYPRVVQYIHRGQTEANYEKKIALAKSSENRTVPILAVGGMPGSGASVFASYLAQKHGHPIWVDCIENTSKESIVGRIALILANDYGQGDLDQLLRLNISKDNPYRLAPLIDEFTANSLKDRDYVLCLKNYQAVAKDEQIRDFVYTLKRIAESDPVAKFVAIILISDERPPIHSDYHEQLEGFSTADDTRVFLSIHKVELPQDAVQVLHNKTEGNPSLLKLFCSLYQFVDGNLAEITKILEGLENRDEVRNAFLVSIKNRLSEDEKSASAVISVLTQPYLEDDAREIIRKAEGRPLSEAIANLKKKYLLSQLIGNTGYYRMHRMLGQYLSGELLDPASRRQIHHLAGGYFESKHEYLRAAHHYMEAGEDLHASDILVLRENRNQIIRERNLGQYVDMLYRFTRKNIREEDSWLSLLICRGDVCEIICEYSKARENYEQALKFCKSTAELCRARIYRKLGWVFQRICAWEEAQKMYLLGLQLIGNALGKQQDNTNIKIEQARMKCELALVHVKTLSYPTAETIGSEGLKALEGLHEDSPEVAEFLAQACYIMGVLYLGKRELLQAQALMRRSEALYERLEDVIGVYQVRVQLGEILFLKGEDKEGAYKMLLDVESDSRLINARKLVGDSLRKLGRIDFLSGRYEMAIAHLEQAISWHMEIGDLQSAAWSHNTLGGVHLERGEIAGAEDQWQMAIGILEALHSYSDVIGIKGNLGLLKFRQGHFDGARTLIKEAGRLADKIGDPNWRFEFLINSIMLDILCSTDSLRIKAMIKQARDLLPKMDVENNVCQIFYVEANLLLEQGQAKPALERLDESCNARYASSIDPYFKSLLLRAEIYHQLHDSSNAIASLDKAKGFMENRSMSEEDKARYLRTSGLLLAGTDTDRSHREITESIKIFLSRQNPLEAAETQYRAGRMYRTYSIQDAHGFLTDARLFFKSAHARARLNRIDALLKDSGA